MSFKITGNSSENSVTKKQFMETELFQGLKDKQQKKLESIFDKFNTTKAPEGEEEVLDKEEQAAMMDWFKKVAGKNDKITRWEFGRKANKSATKENYVKGAGIKDYENFMKAYNEAASSANITKEEVPYMAEEEEVKVLQDILEPEPEEEKTEFPSKPKSIKKVSQPAAWKNANPTEALASLTIKDDNTADKVLAKLTAVYNINTAEVQMDKLKADLIKYNPSVFDKDGNVYDGVQWGKLDFPKNAGELYKNGVQTPQVAKKAAKPAQAKHTAKAYAAKKSAPAKKAAQTKQADAAESAQAENTMAIATQTDNNLPKNVSTKFLRKQAPAAQKGADFSNPLAIGTDFKTGANLNRTPLLGVALTPHTVDNAGTKWYYQKANGKIYYYNQNQQLTSIDDKKNKISYRFYDDSYVEYGEQNGINYEIERNLKGHINKYTTYESGYENVNRNADGSIASLTEYTDNPDRKIYRDANGKVICYYEYADDTWHNPDGTIDE